MGDKKIHTVLRLNAATMPMSDEERGILAAVGAEVVEIEGDKDDEIAAAAKNAEAVMIVSAYLRAPVVSQLSGCKIISRIGTGCDKIDIEEATRRGILVTNLPDFCTNEVADHTLALLLAAARQVKQFDSMIRQGRRAILPLSLRRLSAQTAGLVGFGRIGQAVARRCKAFGLKVLAFDPKMSEELAEREGVTASTLERLLEDSDYVCLLCPLLPSTRGMIGMARLRLMKKSAILVNTGRGELVVETDLATALREGVIRFAAIDVFAGINVFAPDGFPTTHPFFGLENVLMTPHVAATSIESGDESRRRAAEAVADVLSGRWPRHPVNPEVKPRVPLRTYTQLV